MPLYLCLFILSNFSSTLGVEGSEGAMGAEGLEGAEEDEGAAIHILLDG